MKGLILTAGKGTRLRPLSHTRPKPLLPVANQPVIQYGIERLREIGIREIGLVIQPGSKEIFEQTLDHFTDVQFKYIYQHEQKGIAHAVKQAESFIGKDSFILLLGDNLINESLVSLKEAAISSGTYGTVMVTEVEKPEDYGIAEIKEDRIIKVEEKPAQPKSNLAIIGVYLFNPAIFKAIDSLTPSARGEYEITDAIQWMIDHNLSVNYIKAERPTFDVGTMERWLEANQWVLEQNPDLKHHKKVKNSIIIPPVKIGAQCKIKNAVIGPYVSIESGTTIKNCHIKNSIILQDSVFKNIPYEIIDSIFGENTKFVAKDTKDRFIHGMFGDDTSFIFSNSYGGKKKK
ncbi:glucose-1-phosphate thymidylyltransferase [Halobacillus sp. A5]|uniref:glucose-1-phosphate thymidylyltransferase n=1 Tax=Halobacillus sp. A5 TaxID=2880263 RepID=UPI0020A638D9|nr:glucose-1-phosphate thymidylyltransferase [Halobacillus sp. A5]MCP3029436.1 glucose-1-phosphate thymidylyltransferase [Halobacillus sp. A5]